MYLEYRWGKIFLEFLVENNIKVVCVFVVWIDYSYVLDVSV